MCLRGDLYQTAWVRSAGDDPFSVSGDSGAEGFLVRRNIATVERGPNIIAGVFRPLLRPLEEEGPDGIGR